MNFLKLFVEGPDEKVSLPKKLLNILIIVAVLIWLVLESLHRIDVTLDYAFLSEVTYRLKKGFILTLELSLLSMIMSLVIGIISAVGRNSRISLARTSSSASASRFFSNWETLERETGSGRMGTYTWVLSLRSSGMSRIWSPISRMIV